MCVYWFLSVSSILYKSSVYVSRQYLIRQISGLGFFSFFNPENGNTGTVNEVDNQVHFLRTTNVSTLCRYTL